MVEARWIADSLKQKWLSCGDILSKKGGLLVFDDCGIDAATQAMPRPILGTDALCDARISGATDPKRTPNLR